MTTATAYVYGLTTSNQLVRAKSEKEFRAMQSRGLCGDIRIVDTGEFSESSLVCASQHTITIGKDAEGLPVVAASLDWYNAPSESHVGSLDDLVASIRKQGKILRKSGNFESGDAMQSAKDKEDSVVASLLQICPRVVISDASAGRCGSGVFAEVE